ncbi:pyridoxamine 5'-phosphate oxidase family protein [uncultured Jannaschia sp.]|uniref:pyridoxamine 5'-phosphate oxidase family protein n=1 Tax=uncultured Jannaschia sp. TaxID=293347 RepID=UPI00261AB054|nr:pyridoxamine 5'-phosphate oxidase family protein [uncultured Jannaschia sp.]
MSDPWHQLDTLLGHIWDRLAAGVADASDPFRFVALATAGTDGPEARMVGLRGADRRAGTVEVHSDLRTAKIRALWTEPRAALLFWDAATQVQIRLSVEMTLIPADRDRWAEVPPEPRLNYGTDPAPGLPVASPEIVIRTPARDRFIALSGQVRGIDAVSLAHQPHRRAAFDGPDGPGRWVAP